MIIDKLKNAENYYALGENFKKAFEYLKNNDLTTLKNGRYEIDSENIFVSIQDYETKQPEDGRWEAHRKYADIQFLIKGKEQLGFTDVETLKSETTYNEKDDIIFLKGSGQFIKAQSGDFIIFFPQDAHMPCICIEKPEYVKKAVVKIKFNF